jgi:hypothetical protein
MPAFDLTTEHGQRALEHLTNDQMGWLTTVSARGVPQPSPVWFHWDGEAIIHSQPNTRKDVVVVQGTATLVNEGEVSPTSAAFAEKYAGGLAGLGLTAETFVADYSQLIRIAPTRLRGF